MLRRVIFKVYLQSLFYFYACTIYIRTLDMLTTVIPIFSECQMLSTKAKKNTSALGKHDYIGRLRTMFI